MIGCSGSGIISGVAVVIFADVLALPALNSPLDALSRSAEFLRIMIVLVFGSLRLCSRRIPSPRNGLVNMRGGTGGGEMSRGGSSGASGACCDWAADR